MRDLDNDLRQLLNSHLYATFLIEAWYPSSDYAIKNTEMIQLSDEKVGITRTSSKTVLMSPTDVDGAAFACDREMTERRWFWSAREKKVKQIEE